jgi:hypothetical protein
LLKIRLPQVTDATLTGSYIDADSVRVSPRHGAGVRDGHIRQYRAP